MEIFAIKAGQSGVLIATPMVSSTRIANSKTKNQRDNESTVYYVKTRKRSPISSK